MIRNLDEVRRGHEFFLAKNAVTLDDALHIAGDHALEHVALHPEFKPRTGALQAATSFRVVRTAGGKLLKIRNDAKYAAAIDTGAKPHPIVARRAPCLVFRGRDGKLVFTKRVNHPGNRPYKFLYFATDGAFRATRRYLESEMARLAKRF